MGKVQSGPSGGTRRPRRVGRAILAVAMLVGVTTLAITEQPASAAVRPFALRYSADLHGDIAMAANSLLTCPSPPTAACTAAQTGGGAQNNNDFAMAFVDVDGDPTTSNSSSADLALPAGSTVTFAALYWGGLNSDTPADTIQLDAPGGGLAYQNLVASQHDNDTSRHAWFRDVTSLVQAGGAGTYTVGGASIETAVGAFGGWSLQVVYSNPSARLRSLRVFDGYQSSSTTAVSFNLNGLYTPPSGDFDITIGAVAYDGDRASTSDYLRVNGDPLGDAATPVNNFYNSRITRGGVDVGDRSPSYGNNLGFDSKQMKVDGDVVVGNGVTTMTVETRGVNEVVLPQVITTSIDLLAPDVTITKVAHNTSRPDTEAVRNGDVLEYTVTAANTASTPENPIDTATDVRLHDDPTGPVAIVPGSLQVLTGANAGAKTPTAGDDQGTTDGSFVDFYVGTGATALVGGELAPGESSSVRFQAKVTSVPSDGGQTISNQASATYTGKISGLPYNAVSNTTTSQPIAAPATVCSGMSLKVLTLVPTGSNLAGTPCVNDSDLFPAVNINTLLLITLKASGLNSRSAVLPVTEILPGGEAGYADIADLSLNIPAVSLKLTGLHSEAVALGANTCSPVLGGSSRLATLVINGVSYPVGAAPLSIPLPGLGGIYINQTVVTGSVITQRAIFIDLPGTALDVVIGEARAGVVC